MNGLDQISLASGVLLGSRKMGRKNIFQLVEENYNIKTEIRNLFSLFFSEKYFTDNFLEFSFCELLDDYLFIDWKYRGTCLGVKDYLKRVNAIFDYARVGTDASEEIIINALEGFDNFIKLYHDNSDSLYEKKHVTYYTSFAKIFCNNVFTLEKHMGLSRREYKDRVVLYPKNATLEKVLNTITEDDIQWELIRYERSGLTLSQKKKSLAFLATNLNIQQDKNEKDIQLNELLKKSSNILNNLHIRHNNKSGKSKNEYIQRISNTEQEQLCDMLFEMILNICLIRDLKQYDELYKKFETLQKENK